MSDHQVRNELTAATERLETADVLLQEDGREPRPTQNQPLVDKAMSHCVGLLGSEKRVGCSDGKVRDSRCPRERLAARMLLPLSFPQYSGRGARQN